MVDRIDSPVVLGALRPTSEIDRLIGRQLRLRRELQGLSEENCAEAAGVLPAQLRAYEAGGARVPASVLAELARVLNAPISYFFDLIGSREREQSDDNIINFPVDNPRAPREMALAEQELLRSFRSILSPQDRELLLQMAERLAGK